MKDKLKQYVELLFAGTEGSEDLRQEILQNTLDRYDDLVADGKSPEAAYRQAIAGIGDINELFTAAPATPAFSEAPRQKSRMTSPKLITAIAVGLYILCPVPLILGMDIFGVALLLVMIAVATGLLIWVDEDKKQQKADSFDENLTAPQRELRKSIASLISAVTLVLYLAVSFLTGAWYITWVIFPLAGAVKGLIRAILDLKEVSRYEK